MKTISPKQITGYTVFAVLAGIVLAVVRIFVSSVYLEPGIEMYAHGTYADWILHIAIFLCCLVVCSCSLLPMKENPAATNLKNASSLTVFASSLCGFMIAAYDLVFIFEAAQNDWMILAPLLGRPYASQAVTPASAVFMLCLMIISIPAAVFFFKTASASAAEKSSYPVFATFAVVWFILFTLHAYFNSVTALNSPTNIFRILTILSFVMYAIHETRRALDIPLPRWYFPFAYVAILLGIINSVSGIVLYAKGMIVLQDGYLGAAVQLSYVLYIISRLLTLASDKKPRMLHTDAAYPDAAHPV